MPPALSEPPWDDHATHIIPTNCYWQIFLGSNIHWGHCIRRMVMGTTLYNFLNHGTNFVFYSVLFLRFFSRQPWGSLLSVLRSDLRSVQLSSEFSSALSSEFSSAFSSAFRVTFLRYRVGQFSGEFLKSMFSYTVLPVYTWPYMVCIDI